MIVEKKDVYQILGAASLSVVGKVPGSLVCILTLTASNGDNAMSPKNSAEAPATRRKERKWRN
jgi:hypothetical protein